jgi:hypothetical protein
VVNEPLVRPFATRTARSASEVRATARKSPRHQRGFSIPSFPPQCPGLRVGGLGIVLLGEAVNAAGPANARNSGGLSASMWTLGYAGSAA